VFATRERTGGLPRERKSLKSETQKSVLLVGFMGAGKSTVGRALAAELQCEFEDLDERIERREGRTVPEIFRVSGERDFRRMENKALAEVLEELRGGVNRVVALGGGAFAQPCNSSLIEESGFITVFLDASPLELWRRCCDQANDPRTQRPLLQSFETFQELYQSRRPNYLKADVHQRTEGKDIGAIVEAIIRALGWKRSE
jgi:shikimate kinase